jgi:hypothetical protein
MAEENRISTKSFAIGDPVRDFTGEEGDILRLSTMGLPQRAYAQFPSGPRWVDAADLRSPDHDAEAEALATGEKTRKARVAFDKNSSEPQ